MTARHTVYLGDSRDVLPQIEDESVALVVTSPPYFVRREYEHYIKDEIDYWNIVLDIFLECVRRVDPFGKVAINFADSDENEKEYGRTL